MSSRTWLPKWRAHAALICGICVALLFSTYAFSTYDVQTTWPTPHRFFEPTSRINILRRQSNKLPSGTDRPLQELLVFVDTPESINKTATEVMRLQKELLNDTIKSVTVETATFENVVLPFVRDDNENASLSLAQTYVYPDVSPSADLQKASNDAIQAIEEQTQELALNEDYFKLVDAVYQKQKDDPKLDAESRKVLKKHWEGYKDGGLGVPKGEKRDHFKKITNRIAELEQEFTSALSADDTTLWFTKEELDGVKPDTLGNLKNGTGEHEGKLGLVLLGPDVGGVTSYAKNMTVRKKITIEGQLVVPENVKRLEEAVALRDESARMLKYPNFATWKLKDTMAKDTKSVNDFEQGLRDKLKPPGRKQLEHLRMLKKNETRKADRVYLWDAGYYAQKSFEEEYKLDANKIKEWFPAIITVRRILDLYSHLFGLEFIKLEGKDLDALSKTGKGKDLVWQEDVEVYSVYNTEGDKGFVGILYLDLFYRPLKPSGASVIPLEDGWEKKDGSRHYPAAVLVTDFRKSTTAVPSLLLRSEVQTIMHEAGHVIHQLTSYVKYSQFHGFNGCPRDWVEMPSQLMENWIYEPAVLKKFSKHWSYQGPKEKEAWTKANSYAKQPPEQIPDNVINAILGARNAFSSLNNLEQIFYGVYDQQLHQAKSQEEAKNFDSTTMWNRLHHELTGYDGPDGKGYKWGHGQSHFSHIMSGYDAGYYAYLWSVVNADDVFQTMFKKDVFSKEAGMHWRKSILQVGGTKEFEPLLTDYLGHKPSDEAFLKELEVI